MYVYIYKSLWGEGRYFSFRYISNFFFIYYL